MNNTTPNRGVSLIPVKITIILTMFLAMAAPSFGQQIAPKQNWKDTDYYKTSRGQKTAAWILTGVGITGFVITAGVSSTDWTTSEVTNIFSGGTVETEHKSYAVPYALSAACVVSGIYLFVASHINRNKAKATSVFIDMENAPLLQGTVFSNQSFPAAGVRIRL
jgi:hypothetical protein